MKVQFVEVQSTKEAFHDLNTGTIDMLANVSKTKERSKDYLFSEYDLGKSSTGLFVKDSDDRWNYGNINQIKKMTIACQKGEYPVQAFLKWSAQYGLKPTIHYYDTKKATYQAVSTKKDDAFVEREDYISGYQSLMSFSPSPYYLIFAKQNTSLKIEVDSAMAEIFKQDPLYATELAEKYQVTTNVKVSLTKEEKSYVKRHKNITVAVLNDDAPYFEGSSSSPAGIIPDIYREIGKETGFHFQYRIYDTQGDAIRAIKSGESDVLAMYSNGVLNAFRSELVLTRKYTTAYTVMITRKGTKVANIDKIAVKKRSKETVAQGLPNSLENASLFGYDNASHCMKALINKDVDAMIIGLPSATYLINQIDASEFDIKQISTVKLDLCGATSLNHRILNSILNKGIQVSSYMIDTIVANNTVTQDSIQTTIARIPANAILIFAIVMIVLVLILIWAVIILFKSRKERVEAIKVEAAAEEKRIRAEGIIKSAEAKNDFLSTISHDMRTPLNAIMGYATLAQSAKSQDEVMNYVGKIRLSGDLLMDLINDTLTISKMSSHKMELKLEPIDTLDLSETIISPIYNVASQKHVHFIVNHEQVRHRTIMADKLNLEKIFLNLLSNAVKFTPPGGTVTYTIKDDPVGGKDPSIIIIIIDNGIGMSQDYQLHMFEPFSQEKRKGYESLGTGLGLSIVKQLVDLMGGTIIVNSVVDEGTTFTIRLHFLEVDKTMTPEKPLYDYDFSQLHGKHILLCEDNFVNREVATALLNQKGMSVECVENGQQGVEYFQAKAPGTYDAILMDVRMPVMNGYEATHAIRNLPRKDAKTIPIIAMTADAFAEDIAKCLEAGMNGHVAKPIDPEMMFKTLIQFITIKTPE